MSYEKPECVVLGDAVRLIQGSKKPPGDGGPGTAAADCELDD